MPTFFIVRATVSDPAQRAAFDKWYRDEHLPDAALDLKPIFNRHLLDLVENLARAHVLIVTLAER